MKCWILSGRSSGTWWVDAGCSAMRGLLSFVRSVLLLFVLVLVRVERFQRRQPVPAGGELDLQRLRAGFDESEDLLVLVHRLAGAARHEAEGGVTEHGEAVPAAVHEVEDV